MAVISGIGIGQHWADLFGETEHGIGQPALIDQPQGQDSPIVAHRDGRTGDVCVQIGGYTYPIELEPVTPNQDVWTCYSQQSTYWTDNRFLQGDFCSNGMDHFTKMSEFTHESGPRYPCKLLQNRQKVEQAPKAKSQNEIRTIQEGSGGKNNHSFLLPQKIRGYKQHQLNCDVYSVEVDGSQTDFSMNGTKLEDSNKEWYEDLAQYNEDIHFAPKYHSCQNYRQNSDILQNFDQNVNYSGTLPPVSEVLSVQDNVLYTQFETSLAENDNEIDVNFSSTFSHCSKLINQQKYGSCLVESSNLCQWIPDPQRLENKIHFVSNKVKPEGKVYKGNPQYKGSIKPRCSVERVEERTPREYDIKFDIKRQLKKMKRGCRLWEFIRNLLLDPSTNPSLIRWENREEGTFKLVQSKAIAHKWGMKKGNVGMTYEKLSRAMRYYYKRQVFQPVLGKRLVYRFGPRATGWRDT